MTPADPEPPAVLDDPVWWSLADHHAHLGEGTGAARRYRDDVSIFSGFAPTSGGPGPDEWDALAAVVGPGGTAILMWTLDPPPPPEGWTTVTALGGDQMVLVDIERLHAEADRVEVPAGLALRPLGDPDVPAMLALVGRTDPGPFLARTIEMGGYVGLFAGDDLVAMAGERMHPPGFTEISAVCTAPEVRGRGLATTLVRVIARGIADRGETPFLNVAEGNDNARALYERLGFARRRTLAFRAVQRSA